MWSCCCESDAEGSQVSFKPTDERTAYNYSHGDGGSLATPTGNAGPGIYAVTSPTGQPEPEPVAAAALPELPAYEVGGVERRRSAAYWSVAAASPAAAKDGGEEAGAPPMSARGPPTSARSAGSSQDGVASKDTMRLQDLVKEFAKKGIRGVQCGVVDPENGSVRPATYSIDRTLQKLTLKTHYHGGLPAAEETRHVGTITEVKLRQAGVDSLKPEAAAVLDDASRDRLVMISFGDDASMCWLEGTTEEATSFAVCMRVLQVYCQQKGFA